MGHATGGIPIESEFSKDGVYKVISIGSYSTDNTYHDQGIRAIKSEKTKSRLLNKNDLTMILNDKTTIEKNIIGRTLLIEESGVYVYNQRTERIELDITQFDPSFIYEELNAPHIRQKIIAQSQGNTQVYVNWSSISQLVYSIPSLSEQQKIGSFFRKLDDLLALHQRQTQNLTELKQGLLQNMFPREGESVPRLRFPGFTTTWKQHKVQDIYKITRGYVLAAPETNKNPSDDMPYPVYSSQTKNNGLMGYYKDYLYEDAITWTTDGANAGTVNYRAGKFYCTNVCGVLLSEEGYANKCAAEALNNVAWRWVSHVGNPKLMNNVMGEIPISLPVSIEEQNQISRFLEEIDNLIGLYERYVTTLIHLKKGLLQKMFPQD